MPLRIFVSSPGDVAEERALAQQVIKRLQGRFAGRVTLEPIYWEHEPLLATATFQDQIILPSETDIVLCVLWARLGTRLPPHITRSDGSRYNSGTEFEFEDAANAFREKGKPSLMVYRKMADPQVSLQDEKALLAKLKQKKNLDTFIQKWFHSDDGSLASAFSPYEDPAEFEENLETHLSKLIERMLPEFQAGNVIADAPPSWQQGSPYRGLEAFEFEHAPVFFGRTRAIHDVLDALRTQATDGRAFVTVLGMSGGGKSSLARAGVLPLLVQPGVIEGIGLWRRAVMKPADASGDLFAGLAAALLHPEALSELAGGAPTQCANCSAEVLGPFCHHCGHQHTFDGNPLRDALAEVLPGPARSGIEPEELAGLLREMPEAVVPLLQAGLAHAAASMAEAQALLQTPEARLVVLVDQLEEFFTQEHIDHATRAAFVETLNVLARSGTVWILTTMRSDFYPRCGELPRLVALQEGTGQLHLLVPTPAEVGQIIRKPTAAAGLRFDRDPETDERLDEVLRDAAASNPASLPLLEFTLEELYKERTDDSVLTFDAYRRLGGVEGALAQRAEEIFEGLAPTVQAALPSVLRALVRAGQSETVTRKRAPYAALTKTPESKALVDAFVEARLFTSALAEGGEAVVSVSHEALLRHWPRLTDWLEEDRENLRIFARVATATGRWDTGGRVPDFLLQQGKPLEEADQLLGRWRDELSPAETTFIEASLARARRRTQIKRGVVAALAVLAVVAGVSAFVANRASNNAEFRRNQAENLIGFMLGDLRAKLEPVGRLDVLNDVGDKAQDYFASLNLKDLSDEERARLALSLRQIGDVRMNQGNLEGALVSFRQAMTLNQYLAAKDPDDLEKLFDLAQNHFWIGYTHSFQGNLDSTRAAYEAYRAIALRLVEAEPDNPRWLLELSYAYGNMGQVFSEVDSLDGAVAAFQQSIAIHKRLTKIDSTQGEWQYELADGYASLGTMLHYQGNVEDARTAFGQTLAIMDSLVTADPDHMGWQAYLAETHNNLALNEEEDGDTEAALTYLRAAQAAYWGLVAYDSTNADWQAGLADSHDGVGEALRTLGDVQGALVEFQAARDRYEALVAADTTNFDRRYALALLHFKIGRTLEGRGMRAEERAAWTSVAEHIERLPRQDEDENVLAFWAWALLELDHIEEARPLVEKLAAAAYENQAFWDLCRRKGLLVGGEQA